MKIVVLKGGASSEREVSLVSGAEVARALREKGHGVSEIDVGDELESYSARSLAGGVDLAAHAGSATPKSPVVASGRSKSGPGGSFRRHYGTAPAEAPPPGGKRARAGV